MTKLIPSEPDNEDPRQSQQGEHTEQKEDEPGRRRRGKIPSMEDCLSALASLAGAVAMGLIRPAQANPIRASYAEILRHHQRNESRSERKGIGDADLMEVMRKDPKIFSIMEPFLTDEQIDMVMKNAKDGGRG